MSLARYILLSCILMTTLAPSYAICNESVICSTAKYKFDVFHYFTSLSNKDLLKRLYLNEGPRLHGSNPSEPCYEFAGREGLKVRDLDVVENIRNTSCSTNEITIYASVFFLKTDLGGTVIELTSSNKTFLGLSVCRISNEIYLTYRHLGRLVFETFPFQAKTGKWYNISITLTGNLAVLHVNCEEVERRLIAFPDYCLNKTNTTNLVLHTASGYSSNEICPCNALYTGSLQSVGIVCGVNGLQELCPDKTNGVECPLCGQFLTLLNKHNDVKKCVKKLEKDLETCKQNKSTNTTTCPPSKRNCLIDEITYNDGVFVKNKKREICYCRDGNAFCTDPDETPTVPTNQMFTPSTSTPSTSAPVVTEKCPTAVYHGITVSLELGQRAYIPIPNNCFVVTCKKSFATFNDPVTVDCSTVQSNCSVKDEHQQQLTLCCSKCDACDFATCPRHSTCKSAGQSHTCDCNTGFEPSSDKLKCVDRDECSLGRQQGGHNCPDKAECNNTEGSFICQCPTGYNLVYNQKVPECQDIDECATGVARCGPNSRCVNTSPGYRCDCLNRYKKTNGVCTAVCDKDCQNGGRCSAPDTCTCVPGFTGKYCENDIDECKNESLHDCKYFKSRCINTKGGYFCSCKAGHQTDALKRFCKDVNECETGLHNCFKDEHCLNYFGGYSCTGNNADYKYDLGDCKINDINCTNVPSELIIKNGQTVPAGIDKCNECTCNNGEVKCKRRSCDCSQPTVCRTCCPDCFRKNVCHVNEVVLEVGQHYIDPTNRCYQYKCVLSNNEPTLESINKTCSVVRNCPLGYKYTPKGACCPVCELPICSVNNQNQELYVKNGCELCTCNGTQWNCTNVVTCPSIKGCPQEDIASLPDQCCPICLSSCSS